MKKQVIVGALVVGLLLGTSCQARGATEESTGTSNEALAILEAAEMNRKTEFTPEEEKKYLEYIYLLPPVYNSWASPEEIESFRFGTFYGHHSLEYPKYSAAQYSINDTMFYEIPQDVYEEFIQLYFDVSSEHLRETDFYDNEKEVYTGFLPGGGLTTQNDLLEVEANGTTEI